MARHSFIHKHTSSSVSTQRLAGKRLELRLSDGVSSIADQKSKAERALARYTWRLSIRRLVVMFELIEYSHDLDWLETSGICLGRHRLLGCL